MTPFDPRKTHYDLILTQVWTRTDPVTPCTRLCHTLYKTLSHLVPDFVKLYTRIVTPCTRLCHTLYQTLSHLVPGFVKPYTRIVTPCTRHTGHTLYQTLSKPCTGKPLRKKDITTRVGSTSVAWQPVNQLTHRGGWCEAPASASYILFTIIKWCTMTQT